MYSVFCIMYFFTSQDINECLESPDPCDGDHVTCFDLDPDTDGARYQCNCTDTGYELDNTGRNCIGKQL